MNALAKLNLNLEKHYREKEVSNKGQMNETYDHILSRIHLKTGRMAYTGK